MPPFLGRHRSLCFDKYLKLPKKVVKPYLLKVDHGIMVLDPTSKQCDSLKAQQLFIGGVLNVLKPYFFP